MGRCRMRWLQAMPFVLAAALAVTRVDEARAQQTTVTPSAAVLPVNTGDGNQTDPHISGNLVSYTSSVNGVTQIRYFDLTTSIDDSIPATGTSVDFLSNISGTRIAFTRVDSGAQSIWILDTSVDAAPHEIDPQPNSFRRAASIGGDTIAWQDLGFATGEPLTTEIVVYDLASGVATRLTDDTFVDRNTAVAPDGSAIAWEQCATTTSSCDIFQAVKSGGAWSVSQVSATPDPEAFPDTNGLLVVYGARRSGNATGSDIYWTPVAAWATGIRPCRRSRNGSRGGTMLCVRALARRRRAVRGVFPVQVQGVVGTWWRGAIPSRVP